MTVPSAISEMVFRFFGREKGPDHREVSKVLDVEKPYADVVGLFKSQWSVFDDTDTNYSLGYGLLLKDHEPAVWVRLSAVGPFALVHDELGVELRDPVIDDILTAAGFEILSRAVLEEPVNLWGDQHSTPLYQWLFEYDEGLPWAR